MSWFRMSKSGAVSASGAIIVFVVAFAAVILALTLAVVVLKNSSFLPPEFVLPLLVVGSISVLMIGLASMAIIFRRLGLYDYREAMGLPEGSIRAIIALMLIVIFAVVSVFLISNADAQDRRVLDDLTVSQADELPLAEIVSRERVSGTSGAQARYRVVLEAGDRPSAEMSQQLMTTLGTLVVAVAAFYFGSQSVIAAQKARKASVTTTVTPTKPRETQPGNTAPAETAPGETAPGETAPGETAPGSATPAERRGGESEPGAPAGADLDALEQEGDESAPDVDGEVEPPAPPPRRSGDGRRPPSLPPDAGSEPPGEGM